MFKTILAFLKTHIVATVVTTTAAVGVVVTPIAVENYMQDKAVETGESSIVEDNYVQDEAVGEVEANGETEVVEENGATEENVSQSEKPATEKNNEPLTFRTEKIQHGDGYEYRVIPSYDKDYSEWTEEEKAEYEKIMQENAQRAKDDYDAAVASEEQILRDLEAMFAANGTIDAPIDSTSGGGMTQVQ